MPTTARGVVFTGPREVALETIEVPDPGPQQVLVRHTISMASAGTEISVLLNQARAERRQNWPARPGYSAVGIVEAVGSAVEDVKPGDRVVTRGRHASHVLVNMERGAYSATARQRIEGAQLYPIPDGVADEEAVFSALAAVALHGIRKVWFQLGESCAVIGQGVVGQLVGQFARAAGAAPVIGIDMVASRLERSRQSGYHAVVDASREDVAGVTKELTNGRGVDICFEATRTPHAFPTLLRIAALGGRVVMVGSVHAAAPIHLFEELQEKELTIVGAWQPRAPAAPHHYFPWSGERNRETFMNLLKARTVRVDHLITHRVQPEEAPRLYADMAAGAGEWMGVQFVWS